MQKTCQWVVFILNYHWHKIYFNNCVRLDFQLVLTHSRVIFMRNTARGLGQLVMSLWFDAQTYNPRQKKKKKKCSVRVASLCHCRCLSHQSLCFVVPLRICICTSTFSQICIFYLIYNTELFICYVHIDLQQGWSLSSATSICVRLSVEAS